MALVQQPTMKAGDALFFMDEALTHGALAWKSSQERRAVFVRYASRYFNAEPELVQPEDRCGHTLIEGTNEAQLAVMRGPDGDEGEYNVSRLIVEAGHVSVC